jgi:protein-S-isoprenylcysteine O-methyltransferase Ste14
MLRMATRLLILVILWVLWASAFFRKATAPRAKAVVKDRTARVGIVLSGIGFGLVWCRPVVDLPAWRIIPGVIFGLMGIVISRLAVRHLDRQWRFDAALSADHKLIQTGPYAYIRHPIYAGMFAMLLAASSLLAAWPFILAGVVMFILGIEIRIRTEEKLLRGRFGEQFEAYVRRTSAYVPLIR